MMTHDLSMKMWLVGPPIAIILLSMWVLCFNAAGIPHRNSLLAKIVSAIGALSILSALLWFAQFTAPGVHVIDTCDVDARYPHFCDDIKLHTPMLGRHPAPGWILPLYQDS